MDRQIIKALRENQILTGENILTLRKYIREKYPQSTPQQGSEIFADALRKVIDANIRQFDDKYREYIKENLFRRTAAKKVFTINGEELLDACLTLETREEDFIRGLTRWVNDSQPVEVSIGQMEDFLEAVDCCLKENGGRTVERLADRALVELESIEPDAGMPEPPMEESIARISMDTSPVAEKRNARQGLTKAIGSFGMRQRAVAAASAVLLGTVLLMGKGYMSGQGSALQRAEPAMVRTMAAETEKPEKHGKILAEELCYVEADRGALQKWLRGRDSILAEEPYFSAILSTAEKYDINPLLMFAIVGQEQAFVPKSSRNAKKIANNPFNVYGSWQKYNTDIYDSAALAADVIVRSGKDRPPTADPIQWINRLYAEDKEWWVGVSSIYSQLKRELAEAE